MRKKNIKSRKEKEWKQEGKQIIDNKTKIGIKDFS